MAIETRDLTLTYGETVVMENISLKVPRGSFCSVIGPNGCGKSTLLKALSRNIRAAAGSILINGKPIQRYDTKKLSRTLAFLTQNPHVPEQFSVRELVGYGRFPHTGRLGGLSQEDHRIVTRAMEETEITDLADRDLIHLSGGERQRAWIAMALAQESEILLLDEPTTHLDIAHQYHILKLIYRLYTDMGRTILMVQHDINQAVRYSNYLFVIKDGRLYKEGPPEEILTPDMLRDVFSIDTRIIMDDVHGCPFFIPMDGAAVKENSR